MNLTGLLTPQMLAIATAIGIALQLVLTAIVKAYPNAPAFLKVIQAMLADVLPNPAVPQLRASLKKPASVAKVAVLFALIFAGSARAQVVSSGPTLAFTEIRPNYSNPVQVAAGAGYQLSLGFFQDNQLLMGQEVDLLDIGGAIYGSLITNQGGAGAGALGAALFVGTFNEVIAVGIGEDILNTNGTPFQLPPYGLVFLNLQRIALGSPPQVPGVPGVTKQRRFLTTYLGF